MYTVTWQSQKETTTHGSYKTLEEALNSIYAWWDKNDFHPMCVRYWTNENVTTVDYGPHNMFYKIIQED